MKTLEFELKPVTLKGVMLRKEFHKVMYEVIDFMKERGLSVRDASQILEAASSEIQARATQEKV